jgi:hypothetical protein
MSNTFSELAATALIEAVDPQPESGRHLVTSVHGEGLLDTFRALLSRAEDERTFRPGEGPPVNLRVLDNGDGCIIVPYLVQEPPPPNPRENRGSQGFISALRDVYSDTAVAGERMMLVVFDASPNETLLTTMSQGVTDSALELTHLLEVALRPPPDSSQALRRTLAELERLAPRHLQERLNTELVGRTSQAVSELGLLERTEDVARDLHQIPWCLSDPKLFEYTGREFQRRLMEAMRLRKQLGSWATDPVTDFDSEVRKSFDHTAAIKVVEARIGPEIDWSKFTLDDLLSGEPTPPSDDEYAQFAAMPITIEEATATKLLADGKTIAVQVPGPGCSITFNLTCSLTGDSSIHLVGYSGVEPPFTEHTIGKVNSENRDNKIVLEDVPQPRPGWSFLKAVLTKGKRLVKSPLDSVQIAIAVGTTHLPLAYEAGGAVDLEAQAYSGDENLTFIAEQDGEELWSESIEPPESEFGEFRQLRGQISVPVVQASADDEEDVDQHTESPEHLAIEEWAAEVLPPGPLQASLRLRSNDVVVADIGPVSKPIATSESIPASRWSLERHLITHPRTIAFHLSQTGPPAPNASVEDLALGDLESPFEEFLVAREAFFGELTRLRVASVLAADLVESDSAAAYVKKYELLLSAIPDDQPSQFGYDKVLLSDSVMTDSGELYFAPTSPLTVALHMQLQQESRRWLQGEPAGNYFSGDTSQISAQYLVPYLRLHTLPGRWLESGYAPYPWRRYLPFSERSRQERHPSLHRYIGRRIERFLDVHPSYADERRTLRLAFINPGTAAHVRDALLHIVRSHLRRRGGETLKYVPAFDLQLLSDTPVSDELLGADLDLFMGFTPEEGQPSDAAIEVMRRLSYTKGGTSEFLQDPKSFAHITFLEDFFQPRPDLVEWSGDAHPNSMYLGGLAADTERLATIEPSATRFLRATWTGGQLGNATCRIAARTTEVSAAAAGVPVKAGIVRAADVVVPDSQIPELYDRSAWVVHMDRHVGLELFSPQTSDSTAPYILDYTDQETPEPGIFDGITATSQVGPYRARIADVLGKAVEQVVPDVAAGRLLRTLNMISGRWGLEMLRTPDNVLRGRLATALTAQVLEQVEDLHRDPNTLTLVVALDELLRVTGAEGLPLKEGWAAKTGMKGGGSDDLLLLTVPLGSGRPQLKGRIVEVKYRSGAGASPEIAAEQLKATHDALTALLSSDAEPGRQFQGRHLAKLILRYASRHVVYGLRSEHPAITSGTETLSRIAAGDYDLNFGIHRNGKTFVGDYVSVEPSLRDATLEAQNTVAAGVDIRRIRIGGPVVDVMLRTGRVPGGDSTATSTPRNAGSDTIDENAPSPSAPGDGVAPVNPLTDTERQEIQLPETTKHVISQAAASFELPVAELREIGGRLDDVLTSYSLPLQPVQPADAVCGPNTIRFRVRMARGGTIAQVEARERDIMRELGVSKPIMIGQDAGFVTLDVPRAHPVTVKFGDLLPELRTRGRTRGELPVVFGVDLAGRPHIEDLAQLPHLLVAGSTGSGKSVFLCSLLASLVTLPPTELEVVLVDIKGLDFAPFTALPHLRQPPIGNAAEALQVLDELYEIERARRRETLARSGAQSILDYFGRLGGTELTQIVIVIDEFSNLLGSDKAAGSGLEDTVQQYAEIMRSFGIYLVIATQRPSADIVTGRIKSNLPARCALRLPTHNDSMTILGRKGAEQLLGKGDMLFYRDGAIERLQAPLTTADDVLTNSYE